MIRSTKATIIWAVLAGLLAVVPSFYLGTDISLLSAHAPGISWQEPIAYLSPIVILVGAVALLSRGGNRIVAAGVGVAATVLGYTILFGGYELDRAVNWQEVTFVNDTGQEVVAYYSWGGMPLSRTTYLMTGEVWRNQLGYRRVGPGVRFVVLSKGGTATGLREMLGTEQYYELFPDWISPDQEKDLGDRKLFDHTFTWDELGHLGGRVVFTSNGVSP